MVLLKIKPYFYFFRKYMYKGKNTFEKPAKISDFFSSVAKIKLISVKIIFFQKEMMVWTEYVRALQLLCIMTEGNGFLWWWWWADDVNANKATRCECSLLNGCSLWSYASCHSLQESEMPISLVHSYGTHEPNTKRWLVKWQASVHHVNIYIFPL